MYSVFCIKSWLGGCSPAEPRARYFLPRSTCSNNFILILANAALYR